jgi:hypothetical protein
LLGLAALLASALIFSQSHWRADAANASRPGHTPTIGQRSTGDRVPGPAVEPLVRPEVASELRKLRPTILEAARRHNRPELSHMTDREFAIVITLILYNENFGWPEDRIPQLRALTPLYENLQIQANDIGGANLTVWPAKLRPSVALEILRHQVPVPAPTLVITEPVQVAGSRVDLDAYTDQSALYTAITAEITEPRLAVEYLAANMERGLYRARFEGVPVTWRTLAAWHNQGIVSPENIRDSPAVRYYIRRASAYLATARALIDRRDCQKGRCTKSAIRGAT